MAGLSETLVLAGDAKQAEVLLQQGLVDVRGKVPYAEGLYRSALGMAFGDRGKEDESIHNLEQACELLEGCGAVRYAAVARFRLGQRLFSRRKYADALVELAQAGLHAATVGSASFLVTEARRSPLLIEYAASRQPTKAFYTQLKRELRADMAEGAKLFDENNTTQSSELAMITAYALGTDLVRLNDREISASEWQTNKSREMFFYLLLKPGWQHREAILVDLWPEVGAEQGNRMFHITLHRLRQALYPGCVVQQGGMYRLNPLARYTADVIEFKKLVENGIQSNAADGNNLELLEKALALYRGSFLPDCYSEWSEDIRRQLETTYLHTLRNVANSYRQQGGLEKALHYWERLTTESPYEENANLQLVNTLISLQRPIEAERHFQRYMDLLRTEGFELSPVVMRQYEALVQGVPAA